MPFCPQSYEAWDKTISRFDDTTFFHGSTWLEVLSQTYKLTPSYVGCGDRQNPSAIVPVLEGRNWLRGMRGISLPFTDECPPLFQREAERNRIYTKLTELAKLRGWRTWEVRGGEPPTPSARPSMTFWKHTLELSDGVDGVYGKMDGAVRRGIRKAEQSQVSVTFGNDHSALSDFYRLLQLTRRRHGLPPQPFLFFENIQQQVLLRNQGTIALAKIGGKPIAGAVFVWRERHAIYKFGASDQDYQHLRPNNLVMWRMIQTLQKAGCRLLDLGRTSLSNDGLRRFKQSWGTSESKIAYFKFSIAKSVYLSDRDETVGWYNRAFRRMPLLASRILGEIAYRHMA